MRFFDGFLDEVRALPGVESANVVNSVPILDKAGNIPVWDADHPPAQRATRRWRAFDSRSPGYFATMGIPLVAGRDLSRDDTGVLVAGRHVGAEAHGGPPVMVISQSVAREALPGRQPAGEADGDPSGRAAAGGGRGGGSRR